MSANDDVVNRAVEEALAVLKDKGDPIEPRLREHLAATLERLFRFRRDTEARQSLTTEEPYLSFHQQQLERLSSSINFYQPIRLAEADRAAEAAWAVLENASFSF